MNRQQRRALKKVTDKDTVTAIDMMLNMPKECNVCKAHFDATIKEMVMSWTVKVWNKERKVELYCPEHKPAAESKG